MIYDSYVWKKELKKELNNFRKFVAKTDLSGLPGIPDDINLKVEKFFFVSAFIIRKLNEAKKLSDELNATTIPAIHFKRKNKETEINFLNNHRLEEFYNLENGSEGSLGLTALCNTLIHSYIFKVVKDASRDEESAQEKEKIIGILVTSDYSKDKVLYYIKVKDFHSILQETINDYISFTSWERVRGIVINSRK